MRTPTPTNPSPHSLSALHSGRFSDLTITLAAGLAHAAHNVIIYHQSRVLGSQIRITHSYTGPHATLDLSAHDPALVTAVLEFMYAGAYNVPLFSGKCGGGDGGESGGGCEENIPFHARLYGLAREWEVEPLAALAARRFRCAARKQSKGFVEAARVVYSSVGVSAPSEDRVLRDVVVETVVERWREICECEGDAFQGLWRDFEEFRRDLSEVSCRVQ